MTRKSWLLALVVLPACASAPPEPPRPAGTMLAYALPTPPAATYAFRDSSGFEIRGGAIGEIRAIINAAGTAEITYARDTSALKATIRITDFNGSMTNSAMGGGPTATEADIEGPAVLTVSASGEPAVVSMPKLGNTIQRVGVNQSLFRRFFVRLPAERVRAGTVWVDTITISDQTAGSKVDVRDIVTSTFAGDTTANGRTVAIVNTSSQRTLEVSGTNEGVQIAQKLSGTSSGRFLWDPQRNLLVERTETSELSGTFDLPQMGMTGLPVTARGSSRLVLQ
ncbi:MAG: hypothetical protein ACT443_12630 [Gemmatimonadota bacterium]